MSEGVEEVFHAVAEERREGRAGHYDLPESSREVVREIREALGYSSAWSDATTIVVVGIGGSSLGTKAIDRILHPLNPSVKRLLFLENPDPHEVRDTLEQIDPTRSLFLLISKSGKTIETLSLYKVLLDQLGLKIPGRDSKRLIVISDEGSPLHRYAKRVGARFFSVPVNVGGRFSVLSAVGIVPLTLAGYDTVRLLEGAGNLFERFFGGREHHLLHKGIYLAEHRREFPINVLFAYGSYLEDFTKWYVQLWGESLGKRNSRGEAVGLTPLGLIGPVAQHSFLQLIVEGPRDKTVTFLQFREERENLTIPRISLPELSGCDYVNGHTLHELLNAECEATCKSIEEAGVTVDQIILDRLDEENLGELIAYFELLTSIVGTILEVNVYDQPGVERGKKILRGKFENYSK